MSDFVFECPHCRQHLECPVDMAGETLACPACNGEIRIPAPEPSEPTASATAAPAPKAPAAVCRSCKAPLEPGAVLCIQCGTNQKTGQKLRTQLG